MKNLEDATSIADLNPEGLIATVTTDPNRDHPCALRVNDETSARHFPFDSEDEARAAAKAQNLPLSDEMEAAA